MLRVVEVSGEGVATLLGRCGTERKEHINNLAPCHLPDLDPVIDPRLAVPAYDLACELCGFADQGDKMLLCDGCGTGWHLYCLRPVLKSVPQGTWHEWWFPLCGSEATAPVLCHLGWARCPAQVP